jgi:[CysO sulfur-carrier protein]-S-L-cysteine hydrolase
MPDRSSKVFELDWRERAAAVLDPDRPPIPLPAQLLADVYAHARECYPEECCGLLVGPEGRPPQRIVRCTNVQTLRKSRGESDLDARYAYWIDERQLQQALQEADTRGEGIAVVYHSHVDTEAYFSHVDLHGALGPGEEPLYGGAAHMVLSVREGGVRSAVCYVWDPRRRVFVGHPIEPLG